MNDSEILLFYHIRSDIPSTERIRGQFRSLILDGQSIHLYLQNIWKDSHNEDDFITKLTMIYLCELMCGFTYEDKRECEKCPRKASNGIFLVCPFMEFLESEYDIEYIFKNEEKPNEEV